MYPDFEWVLANHCAPVLLGKKPAALLTEKALPKDCPWAQLCSRGFRVLWFNWRGKTSLTLVYHPDILMDVLNHPLVQKELSALGYPTEQGLYPMLRFLRKRFDESSEFPHEVGFFLGYPPEDVIGFMEKRTASRLSGPWKVFGDEERAAAMFEEHDRCKRTLMHHIENGGSLFSVELPTVAVN